MIKEKPHEGRNLKRIREILGVKQEVLALQLGREWNQQKVSLLERRQVINPQMLARVSKQLGITPDAVKHFNDEVANEIITHVLTGCQPVITSVSTAPDGTYNAFEKIVLLYEQRAELYQQKIELYERMLKERDELFVKKEDVNPSSSCNAAA